MDYITNIYFLAPRTFSFIYQQQETVNLNTRQQKFASHSPMHMNARMHDLFYSFPSTRSHMLQILRQHHLVLKMRLHKANALNNSALFLFAP